MKTILSVLIIIILSWEFVYAQNYNWAKRFGGTGTDRISDIKVDQNQNIYFTGSFQGTADFDPGPGITNITAIGVFNAYICKLDPNGELIWVKGFGGAGSTFGNNLTIDNQSNIYIIGNFNDTTDFDPGPGVFNLVTYSSGNSDIFVSKLDSAGNFVSAYCWNSFSLSNYGASVSTDSQNNLYVVGTNSGQIDFDPGPGIHQEMIWGLGVFIVKLDQSGNFIWVRILAQNGSIYEPAVARDTADNLYLTGEFSGPIDFDPGQGIYQLSPPTSTWDDDVFVCKLTKDGNFVWAVQMGGDSLDQGKNISLDAAGNIYLSGYYQGLSDFDPDTSTYYLPYYGINQAIFVCKLSNDGKFIWAFTYPTAYTTLCLDQNANLYTTGLLGGTMDVDPGSGIYSLTGYGDFFMSSFDSSGIFSSALQFTVYGTVWPRKMYSDASSNIYLVGDLHSTGGDFDPGPGTNVLSSSGADDIFIVKLNTITDILEINSENEFHIYPNPASNFAYLKFANKIKNGKIEIFNNLGSLVYEINISNSTSEIINTLNFTSGIYFIKITGTDHNYSKKFIINK